MKTKYLLILFALWLGLALVCALGGGSSSAVAAPRAEGHIEAPGAPAAEDSTELAEVLHVCFGGCLYSSIQNAVDAANDGDVIKVATGVYTGVSARPAPPGYEEPPNSGLITQVVYISKTVAIRGGYTTDNWTTPDPENNPTTLDAQGQGRVLLITGNTSPTIEGLRITGGDAVGLGGVWVARTFDAGGGVYVIAATATISNNWVFGNSAAGDYGVGGGLFIRDSDATLSGNIITNNSADGTFDGGGGGLLLHHSDGATVSGNTFSANIADIAGGLHLAWSGATVTGNTFSANTATIVGGGLFLYYSDAATLSGNTISGNTADWGGGLQLSFSNNATIRDNTIINNTASEQGGGLRLYDSDATLINNIVAENQAVHAGSGLHSYGSSPRLLHNTIVRNTGGDGSGVYVASNSDVELVNTILAGHRVGIYVASGNRADLEGTLWGSGAWANNTDRSGPGTINHSDDHTGDPVFVDPDNGDYHITPASAAIDAGVDAGVDDDIDGNPRTDGHPDIGADEFPHNPGLTITKRATPDTVQPSQQLTYTISVANTGNKYLHATITDTLPLSVTLGGTLIPPGGTLTPPGGTVVLPNGQVAVIWTAVITAPGGTWIGTIRVTLDEDAEGPLINQVEVTTKEGVVGQARAIVNARKVYLPFVLR